MDRSPSPAKYDFAKRAKELRMSIDHNGVRSASPLRANASPSQYGTTKLEAGYRTREASPSSQREVVTTGSFSSPYLKRDKGQAAARLGSASFASSPPISRDPSSSFLNIVRSDSRDRSLLFSSPQLDRKPNNNSSSCHNSPALFGTTAQPNSQFNEQIEQFRKNLIFAHDTISALQRDVRSLEVKVADRDDAISSLERKNSLLHREAEGNQRRLEEFQEKKATLEQTNEELIRKHAREIEVIKKEYGEVSDQSSKIRHLSRQNEEAVQSKQVLEDTLKSKEEMIQQLRKEIWRLNEEVADGECVRKQAESARDEVKDLQEKLAKANAKGEENAKTIDELKTKNRQLTSQKDKEQQEFEDERESSFAERTNRLKEKVTRLESELDKAQTEKDEADDQIKAFQKRIAKDEKTTAEKDHEIQDLLSELGTAKARELDLQSKLEKANEDLAAQRLRFEQYSNECAMEQETVSALEQAIEQLERAQNERIEENTKLVEENSKLSKTVEDAELCISSEIQHSTKLKHMLDELAEINHDLGEQLRQKEDAILTMKTTEQNLTALLQSAQERNERLEAERDKKVEAANGEKEKIAALEGSLAEREESLASLKNEYEALKVLHHTASTQLKSLREESTNTHEETELKLSQLARLVEDKESEIEELNGTREKMQYVISKLEDEVEELKSERMSMKLKGLDAEKAQKEADEARQARRGMEMEIKELQDQLAEANEAAISARAKMNEQQETVSQLRETLEKSRINSHKAWSRLKELEEIADSSDGKLKSKLVQMEQQLEEKEQQLFDSRKGVAEAQKMIYRLMATVKEVRRKAREEGMMETTDVMLASE